MSCCDDDGPMSEKQFGDPPCSHEELCDHIFFSCVRPLGTNWATELVASNINDESAESRDTQLGCLQPTIAIRSEEFSDGATVTAGMRFEVTATRYEVGCYFKHVMNNIRPGQPWKFIHYNIRFSAH